MAVAREFLVKFLSRYRPQLFYYKADSELRSDISVNKSGFILEIVNHSRKQIIRINVANAVYLVDMINHFDYYFGSAGPVEISYNSSIYSLIDFSTPRLHNVTGFDDFAILCPSSTEPFETIAQYLDFAELKEGDVAIDFGSYSALTTIAFSKAVGGQGKVLAFEPDPLNLSTVKVNVAAHILKNKLDNITIHDAAVSAETGILEFSSEGAMGSSFKSIVGGGRGGKIVRVESLSPMDIMKKFNLSKVDFIKMDIEGAEKDAILGSREFLTKYRPKLVIEPHYVDGVLSSELIVPFLTDIGYNCSEIASTGDTRPLIAAVHSDGAFKP